MALPDPRISEVRYSPASMADAQQGLIGFITVVVDEALRIDGLALRRTLAGDLRLSWPTRIDRAGEKHAVVRPISDDARRQVEQAVFDQLGIATGTSS
jgi:DNA-binding cell septation regulator SpoVG